MQTFLTVCLLTTFIPAGESLSCMSCWNLNHTCEGPLKDCPSDKDICGITQMRTDLITEVIEKSCSRSRDCKKPITSIQFSTTGVFWLSKTTCCMGEECEKVIPPLPFVNTTHNWNACPACYSEKNLDCKGVTTECTGDNIYCVGLTGTGSYGNWTVPISLKGCTNRNFCHDVHVGSSSRFLTINRCHVYSGLPSPIPGSPLLFLQTISELLLLKILL